MRITDYLMWQCESKDLAHEAQRAAARYQERCGVAPKVILVNDKESAFEVPGLTVCKAVNVAKGTLWVGMVGR